MNIPSNIKAIPVAVMLAMSPLTTTNASEIMNQAQVEAVYNDDLETENGYYIMTRTPDVTKIIPKQYKSAFPRNVQKDRYREVMPTSQGDAYIFTSKNGTIVSLIKPYESYWVTEKNNQKNDYYKFMVHNIDLKK